VNTVRAFIGLGANLGDAQAALAEAFVDLAALPQSTLVRRSSLYRSAPIDSSGPDYLNAVAELRTALSSLELLQHLQAIECRHGRERPYRNAPRTLDLDLLVHGDEVCNTAGLTLPHPRLHERAFVLLPWAEISPEAQVPLHGLVRDLLSRVVDQRIERLND